MSLTLKALPDADINGIFRYESQPKLADQVLNNKPTVIAMSLCKHEEADTSVSST